MVAFFSSSFLQLLVVVLESTVNVVWFAILSIANLTIDSYYRY